MRRRSSASICWSKSAMRCTVSSSRQRRRAASCSLAALCCNGSYRVATCALPKPSGHGRTADPPLIGRTPAAHRPRGRRTAAAALTGAFLRCRNATAVRRTQPRRRAAAQHAVAAPRGRCRSQPQFGCCAGERGTVMRHAEPAGGRQALHLRVASAPGVAMPLLGQRSAAQRRCGKCDRSGMRSEIG